MRINSSMILAAALALAGCTDVQEDVLRQDEGLAQGGSVPLQIEGYTAFVQSASPATRTYMHADGSFDWYPDPEEKLWVIKEPGDIRESVGSNLINAQKDATFYFPGHYTLPTYQLLYTGEVNANNENGMHANQVTISRKQLQEFPNQPGRHVAFDGDCGVATAVRQTDEGKEHAWYEFKDGVTNEVGDEATSLRHKAHYLVFHPVVTNDDLRWCHLLRVRVEEISDQHTIAGTYEFGFDGLNTTTNVQGGSSKIDLYCTASMDEDGNVDATVNRHRFDFYADHAKNPTCIMVIQPGTHRLRFTYSIAYYRRLVPGRFVAYPDQRWVENTYTDNVMEWTTEMSAAQGFDAGKYTEVNHQITLPQPYDYKYNVKAYHAWDSPQYYWYGNESYIVDENDEVSSDFHLDEQSFTFLNEGQRNGPRSQTAQYATSSLPDANQMTYYVKYGDIHRDEPGHDVKHTTWLLEGLAPGSYGLQGDSEIPVICTGGIWVLKKAHFQDQLGGQSWDGLSRNAFTELNLTDAEVYPTDQTDDAYRKEITQYGIPTEKEKYFFLPDLGCFYSEYAGQDDFALRHIRSIMRSVGMDGFYWTATKYPKEQATFFSEREKTENGGNGLGTWNVRSAYYLFINNREPGKTYVGISWYDRYNHTNNHIRRNGYVGGGESAEWFQ